MTATRDLYALLGVPEDADATRLRHVYESHVSAAVRSHDHQRALALSAAFDALPTERRQEVYSRLASRPGVVTAQRPGLPRGPKTGRNRRTAAGSRPTSFRRLLGCLVVTGMVVGLSLFLARRVEISTNQSVPPQQAALPVQSGVLSTDLDQRLGRADVSCPTGTYTPGSTITCQGSDGASWTVTVLGSPDRYTITRSSVSPYAALARRDAEGVVAALAECRRLRRGTFPSAVRAAAARASFPCGRATLTVELGPGDTLRYARTGPRSYRLVVIAATGQVARYDSVTGLYS